MNADALSRRPCYSQNCKYCERYEKLHQPEAPLITDSDDQTVAKVGFGWLVVLGLTAL